MSKLFIFFKNQVGKDLQIFSDLDLTIVQEYADQGKFKGLTNKEVASLFL